MGKVQVYIALVCVTTMCWASSLLRAGEKSPTESAFPIEELPAGYVRGDVVSYSYVPNRYWGRAEAIGKLPYLFEYGLMKQKDGDRLEKYHKENIRRIDLASQWSTAIMLSPRFPYYRDELINLMIRCFKHRQLIILAEYIEPDTKEPLAKVISILDKLWENRDTELTSPEGDQATGRQLINNILAVKLGDEEFAKLKTDGLAEINRIFGRRIKDRLLDGRRPFAHIKTWYNEVHCGFGTFAIDRQDLAEGRPALPDNLDFFGVDVYHWWGFETTPFDPDDPNVTRRQIIDHSVWWQSVITKYYGEEFRVTRGDPWTARHKNDTHALMQALDLAGADHAMMLFIGTSEHVKGVSYTTPIEVMDAYYDSLKAGPWVGLSWWLFEGWGWGRNLGTLFYIDKKLIHYTPEHPEGIAYTAEELEDYRKRFIASRMRMFNDVVYNQFGHLNGPAPKP